MGSSQYCCNNFYSMHFSYINGKPFILCIKYFKEAMKNLSMNSRVPCLWTSIHLKLGNKAWLQSILPPGRRQSLNEWHLYCRGSPRWQSKGATNSILLRNQFSSLPSPGVTQTRITQVNWKDTELTGLDGPCGHEEILIKDGVSDCHQSRLWSRDNIRSCP